MPSAVRYIPPTDNERDIFNSDIRQERLKRRLDYRTALKYYLGDQDDQLEYEDGQPNDNTKINLVKMTADRTVSFLFSEIPQFSTDKDVIGKTEEDKWVEQMIEHNGGLNLLTKLGLRGFLAGHNFVRIKPIPRRFWGRKNYYPKLVPLDPTSVSVYWRADDTADVLWYEYRYMVGNRAYIQDFVHDEDTDYWKIYTFKSVSDPENLWQNVPTHHGHSRAPLDWISFETSVFEQEGTTELHTSRIPPIVEFPHLPHPDDYYGLGGSTQKDLQDMINRIASERNRIVRENSDPIDILTGADIAEIEEDGGLFSIPNASAKINRLEMRGDLSGVSDTLDKMIETYLAIARVVLLKGEAKDLQRVTNASVRTLFLDALAQNRLLQQNYGLALRKLARLALEMGFQAGYINNNPDGIQISVEFSEPLPTDETEIANSNAIGIQGGWMDRRTASTRFGLRWDAVKAQLDREYDESFAREQASREIEDDGEQDSNEVLG